MIFLLGKFPERCYTSTWWYAIWMRPATPSLPELFFVMKRPGAEALVGGGEKMFPSLNLFLVQQRRSLTDGMSFVWLLLFNLALGKPLQSHVFFHTESKATEEKHTKRVGVSRSSLPIFSGSPTQNIIFGPFDRGHDLTPIKAMHYFQVEIPQKYHTFASNLIP